MRRSLLGLACVLWLAGVASAADPQASDFDPWAGIDRDGRIPKPELPDDITHPERWRYIPEGRIKPGNPLQRFLVSSFVAPFFFNSSDVGFGGGVALTDIDFRQQRRQEFAGVFLSYTTEGQQAYTGVWRRWLHRREAEGGGVFQEERSFLRAWGGYEKSLTRRFYGFGDTTSESDETSYSDETAFGRLGIELAVPEPGADWVVAGSVMGEWHGLGRGRVKGAPDTQDIFPSAFFPSQDHWLVWLETELRYDTRDSQRLPYRGFAVGVRTASALLQSDSDVGAIFTVFATKLFPLPPLFHDGGDPGEEHPPTDSLAFQLQSRASAGDLPFFSLPQLGGRRTLRGFVAGRFRDRTSWHGSLEYRFWILPRGFPIPFTEALRVERFGLALFGDVGSVGKHWDDLFSARVHANAGIGIRATLERSAPFRVDVGFSGDGVEVSAGFGLSF
ncbi:MAG: BamA/TamA family outer membrane protein [Deltaproteobacteria bacterium]|nr:BamA/TamA family outer membrane protein [Deltaproteobacteria bacterium]